MEEHRYMGISKSYIDLLNGMSLSSLKNEKRSILLMLQRLDLTDDEFYDLIKKLELIHLITLQNTSTN
jgi:Cdc6-like AAA superfamily ATPase